MNELKAPSLQSLLESDRASNDSLLAESLQLDFDDLDDVEYSIPTTGALPSLETVLNEFEADSDIASELGVPIPTPTPTPSIAEDSAVRGSGGSGGGSIMRYAMMQGISAQIASAADRINAGLATSCAVAAFIAVGTSHGHILNFDVTQTLRWAHQDKNGQGAVSSLAFNSECTRLLAGYARGLIAMFDTHSGDVLRQIFDAMTPNTGVLHVKWTSRTSLALCADSGGSVWSLSFTRKLGIRGYASRCLFSGSRGEVCAVEPLIMSAHGQHELDQYCIVALATLSKYFIVIIRPRLKVIKYHALLGPADCLPVLAWQMVLIQAADTSRSVDPVLVVGRGTQLYFHQLFVSNGRITLLFLRHVQLHANLLSAHWLGPKCVGCMDTSEILHLIDVRSSKELECIDMANAGVVYNSAQFKGLATGGNVSPAMALAGTHACYNSITTRGTQLYLLGSRSLHMIGVRTWSERIGYLVKHQRWQEACDLALEGYRAAADRPKRRAQAKERILLLFKEYVAVLARVPNYCLGSIVKCLITIGELDLLWSELWDRLQNTEQFLCYISEHIENDFISSVNPIISQALVDYWLKISPAKLEEIILKLDWTCLDLNQVLKAVKQYKLYRAQIYLNTRALNDYTASLTELMPCISDGEPAEANLGNCLLVYISSCLAGRGYPSGEIPPEQVHTAKHEVLRCLTSLHSSNPSEGELPYPYLRALLKFDTRETLNVISLAFQEREFAGDLGLSYRKRIINILLEIMTPENATWAEIGCLLNFIAQQISQQSLPSDAQLLENVLSYLAQEKIVNESARQHSERESAWHELLVNNCLELISNDEQQLQLAKRARCFYVEEYLLEKLKRYNTILECYLNNELRHETLFAYIERYAYQPERCIYPQLRDHFKRLLDINAKETARVVDMHFREHLDELLAVVQDDEKLLFLFLEKLHKRHMALTNEQSERLLELTCQEIDDEQEVLAFLDSPNANYDVDKALAIVKNFKLTNAGIYLAEKQKNYKLAFEMAMELLKSKSGEEAEKVAQQVSAICARASSSASAKECEGYWFALLQYILPREDLKSITKSMLHEASQHVDLLNLVQLVMNTHNVSGSFGDIKELLMSMLSSARYETQALRAAAKILGDELQTAFSESRQEACRGLWVTTTRCVQCQQRLYNQKDDVLVLGTCGHAVHEECVSKLLESEGSSTADVEQKITRAIEDDDDDDDDDYLDDDCYKCPSCSKLIKKDELSKPMQLSASFVGGSQSGGGVELHLNNQSNSTNIELDVGRDLGELQLKCPPRRY